MNISDEMLVAYVDGELSADDVRLVEEYISAHPSEVARIADWRANDDALRGAFELSESQEPAVELPFVANDNSGWPALTKFALAACLFLAVGFGGGLISAQLPFWTNADYKFQVAAWAAEAHTIFATDENRPGEFDQKNAQVAKSWLKNRVGTDVVFPDLSDNGLKFVGARLVGQGGAPAALMTFENTQSERVSIFIQAHEKKLPEIGYWFVHGENATTCVWLNQSVAFSVTGNMADDDLKAIALVMANGLDEAYTGRDI